VKISSPIRWVVALTAPMIFMAAGCSKPQGGVKEVRVDAARPTPNAWETSKASEQDKERFRKQVAEQAEFFAKQSRSAYASSQKKEKSIWEKLWPWGRKKITDKMDLKEFKFSAEYPNQRK
jgi:hypothetical protein